MKKNQLFVLLISLLVIIFVFTACNRTNVVGKWIWEMTRTEFATISETTAEVLQLFGIPEKFDIAELVLAADGKHSLAIINPKDGTREVLEGTYTVSGKTIAITTDENTLNGNIDGNKITIFNENIGQDMVFIKQ